MSTTAPPADAFEIASSVDVSKHNLSVEESQVLAKLLGRRATMADLQREARVPPSKLPSVVEGLVKKGILSKIGAKAQAEAANPYVGVIFSAAELREPVDLTEEQKKRILFVEMNIGKWSHYKLLGLKKTAPAGDIKAGYFKSSKEFHPDAYFRKNLGSYRERVDKIFRSMKLAYDLLSDDDKREEYDRTAVIELTPEEEEELARRVEQKKLERLIQDREKRNQAHAKEARLKRNPMTERIKKARDLMDLAEEAQQQGRLEEAVTHAKLAVGYDPSQKVRADRIVLMSEKGRAQTMMKRVNQILAYPSDTKEKAAELNTAVDEVSDIATRTKDGHLLTDVARAMLKLNRFGRASKLASDATESDQRNARAWEVLAEATVVEHKWALLLKAAERWLALEPDSSRAKELLKEAKKKS